MRVIPKIAPEHTFWGLQVPGGPHYRADESLGCSVFGEGLRYGIKMNRSSGPNRYICQICKTTGSMSIGLVESKLLACLHRLFEISDPCLRRIR